MDEDLKKKLIVLDNSLKNIIEEMEDLHNKLSVTICGDEDKRKIADEQIAMAKRGLAIKAEEERVTRNETKRRKIAAKAIETNAVDIYPRTEKK
jgi:hypothetical protein